VKIVRLPQPTAGVSLFRLRATCSLRAQASTLSFLVLWLLFRRCGAPFRDSAPRPPIDRIVIATFFPQALDIALPNLVPRPLAKVKRFCETHDLPSLFLTHRPDFPGLESCTRGHLPPTSPVAEKGTLHPAREQIDSVRVGFNFSLLLSFNFCSPRWSSLFLPTRSTPIAFDDLNSLERVILGLRRCPLANKILPLSFCTSFPTFLARAMRTSVALSLPVPIKTRLPTGPICNYLSFWGTPGSRPDPRPGQPVPFFLFSFLLCDLSHEYIPRRGNLPVFFSTLSEIRRTHPRWDLESMLD